MKWALRDIGWWHGQVEVWGDAVERPEQVRMGAAVAAPPSLALVDHELQEDGR